jgi:hypothetical protein
VAVFSTAALLVEGSASAARPVYPVAFTGPSAHSAYTVTLNTGCSGGGTSPCSAIPTASYLEVLVTTAKASGKCPGNTQFTFAAATLKSDGSFSASQAYENGLTLKVNGRFTSSRSAHGTVSGTGGCGTASFTLALPHPDVPVETSPCYWLDKAHALATVTGHSKPAGTLTRDYSVLTGLGGCDEWVGPKQATYTGTKHVTISMTTTAPGDSGFPGKIKSFGTKTLYYYDYYGGRVYFQHGAAWVEVIYTVNSASKPAQGPIGVANKRLLVAAKHVYALMR